MKNLFIFLLIGFGLIYYISCKKKPNYFSDWKINGTAYRSNNVTVSEGKGIVTMACYAREGFSLVWYTSSGFPDRGGMWLIADGSSGTAGVGIYHEGKYYMVSPNEVKYLNFGVGNGTIEFQAEPAWFINYENPADSVLVEGVFRRP
ncbi:MAG: hypothetical protein BGO31_18520 [Bacteroidetes bacterium 43-16]|nr:MAG: hypothetical protein BGO31_18520 [Bacteroidetes bacterium 43-16]